MAFLVVALLALPCIWAIWVRVPAGLSFQPVSLKDLRATLRNGPIMIAVLFTATFLSAIYIVFTYLAPLLTETMGFGRNGITAALVVSGLGAVVGNICRDLRGCCHRGRNWRCRIVDLQPVSAWRRWRDLCDSGRGSYRDLKTDQPVNPIAYP